MEKNTSKHPGVYWVAGVFIAVGLLLLGRNLNIVSDSVYHIIVSWQMLLIVIGVNLLTKKQITGSFVLIAIGVYFLLPEFEIFNHTLSVFFWPAVLIISGILFIVSFSRKKNNFNHHNHHQHHHRLNNSNSSYSAEQGYINLENNFGAIQQIFTEETFRGGKIKNSFGSVVLDLRRTTLQQGVSYLDLDLSFGGVEIHAPAYWNITSELNPFLGGIEDSRLTGVTIDSERTLILRGSVSFSGVEIKG